MMFHNWEMMEANDDSEIGVIFSTCKGYAEYHFHFSGYGHCGDPILDLPTTQKPEHKIGDLWPFCV